MDSARRSSWCSALRTWPDRSAVSWAFSNSSGTPCRRIAEVAMAADAGGARQDMACSTTSSTAASGQRGVPVKPHGPVPNEARAMAVVAGQMVLRRRLPKPQAVVSGRAGARDTGVVPKCGFEFRAAIREDQHSAPRSADNRCQPGDIRSGKAGRQQLPGPGDAAQLGEVVHRVHQASTRGGEGPRNPAIGLSGQPGRRPACAPAQLLAAAPDPGGRGAPAFRGSRGAGRRWAESNWAGTSGPPAPSRG